MVLLPRRKQRQTEQETHEYCVGNTSEYEIRDTRYEHALILETVVDETQVD